jgi:hypothetical protein
MIFAAIGAEFDGDSPDPKEGLPKEDGLSLRIQLD